MSLIEEKNTAQSLVTRLYLLIGVLFYAIAVLAIFTNLIQFDFQIKLTQLNFLDNALLVLGVFGLSSLFQGYLAPLVLLVFGISEGNTFAGNLTYLIRVLPLLIACYAGMQLGYWIQQDLKQNTRLETQIKKIGLILLVAIILAIGLEFLIPSLPIITLNLAK
ncbi:MAG: hypothetical protein Q7S92_07070 [Candidatus Diapherotrites archaeon]|nr:hypothetical protein [Candidatus Diapherotrites archaeon]